MTGHCSGAAATARLLQLLILAGAPDALLRVAHRVVSDELDHAQLAHQAFLAYGGRADHLHFDPQLPPPLASLPELLPALLTDVLRGFCFGETLAVPFFAAMHKPATGPAREVLERIIGDEAGHALLGWDSLDWLLELLGDEVKPALGQMVPSLVADFARQYGERVMDGLTPAEEAAGLLSATRYRALYWQTLQGTILPRLAARGIPVVDGTARPPSE